MRRAPASHLAFASAALLLVLFCGAATAAQEHLTVFHLQHRVAAELVPALRPLLGSEGAVSASGNKLIVRTTPERLKEISAVIEQLDTAPQQLIVTVRQGARDESTAQGGSVSGELRDGDARGRVRIYSTGRRDGGETIERLRTVDGRWARIDLGQAVPIGQRRTVQSGGSTSTEESVQYLGVTSGFDVRAHTVGDEVTIEIRPHRAQLAPEGGGRIDIQSLTTTVGGRLGQWIELGSHAQQTQQSGGGLVFSTRRDKDYRTHTYLNVERAAGLSESKP